MTTLLPSEVKDPFGLERPSGGSFEEEVELSIVMPCLNEAETLAICITKARSYLDRAGIVGEIVVADNGSNDGSQELAAANGARVVDVKERGYGAALSGAILAARGKFVVMGDADDSYDFSRLDPFVSKLREGFELVMGNRFRGGIAPGAMPPLHRYLGNPVLSGIGRLFFTTSIRDFHCGLRGFNRRAIEGLQLRTTGMEFASEMVVKASLADLRIAEVPTTLSPDGRSRPPHLRSWRDGWRHLRFLLLYAPRSLFLFPGIAMVSFGLLVCALVLPGPLKTGSVVFDVHTLIIGSSSIIVGTQVVICFLLAKQYATNVGLLPLGANFTAYPQSCQVGKCAGVRRTHNRGGFHRCRRRHIGLARPVVRCIGLFSCDASHHSLGDTARGGRADRHGCLSFECPGSQSRQGLESDA